MAEVTHIQPIAPFRGAVRFAIICCGLFLLCAVTPDFLLEGVNLVTAALVNACLACQGSICERAGSVLTVGGFRVRIITECTSVYLCILYAAAVFSQPATLAERLRGLLSGIILLSGLNVIRIAAVTLVGARRPEIFEILHLYLGQVVMIFAVIALCVCWIQRSGSGDLEHQLLRAAFLGSLFFLPWFMVNLQYVALVDRIVNGMHLLMYPGYRLDLPRPFPVYNHTFAVPLVCALIAASTHLSLRRRLVLATGGTSLIVCWHVLFRVTHVMWTAYHMAWIEPVHQVVYLIGQYLLPFLIWWRLVRTSRDNLPTAASGLTQAGPPVTSP